MKTIINIATYLNENIIWGIPMVSFMVLVGIYLCFVTKGVIFLRFKTFLRLTIMTLFKKTDKTRLPKGALTPFQSLCTALAATIGTGNVIGVGIAIATGGPGAIFWLWISALIGMVIKYCEVTLAVAFKRKTSNGEIVGGPMYYISYGLHAKWLAFLFAFLCVLASFGIGASVQANAISSALKGSFSISHTITGFIVSILAGFVIIGGIKRIATMTERLVPFMSLLYILGAGIAIFVHIKEIPVAFELIFKSAFSNTAAMGGFLGASAMKACKIGITRGVFTHEAGMGSSSIAHASAYTDHPAHQGLWGAFEVFFDSIIICTITALVMITSGFWKDSRMISAPEFICSFAFENTFKGGKYVVSIGLSLFAFASILAWYYYGEACLKYLFYGNRSICAIYQVIYIVMIFIGAVTNLDIVWKFSDLFNGLMAIPNLIALILLAPVVGRLTKEYYNNFSERTKYPQRSYSCSHRRKR